MTIFGRIDNLLKSHMKTLLVFLPRVLVCMAASECPTESGTEKRACQNSESRESVRTAFVVVASYRKCAALLRLIFVRAYLQVGEKTINAIGRKNQMSTHKNWVRDLQQRYSDQLLTIVTLLLLLMMFVVAPLQAAGAPFFQALGFVAGFAIIIGVLVISSNLTAFVMMMIAFTMNVAVVFMRLLNISSSNIDLQLLAAAWMILAVTLGWVVARAVFGPGSVNYHRIIGAVLLYLLIALVFVSLFTFVDLVIPKAFSGLELEDNREMASRFIYFSFVTLTTTGYGDIYPIHPVARSLCNLEAIIGQLYPATLLARLVSLHASRS